MLEITTARVVDALTACAPVRPERRWEYHLSIGEAF